MLLFKYQFNPTPHDVASLAEVELGPDNQARLVINGIEYIIAFQKTDPKAEQ